MDELNQIFERFPSIIECLHEEGWRSYFKQPILERAQVYAVGSRIKSLRMRETALNFGKIEAEVKGSAARPYEVKIFFEERGGVMHLEPGNCGCVVGVECKHSAAVLIYLQKRSGIYGKAMGKLPSHALDWQTKEWLKRIEEEVGKVTKTADKKAKVYDKFLAYCLEKSTAYESSPVLSLRIAKRLKGGGISLERSHAAADPVKQPKYMADEDIALVIRYRQLQKAQYSYNGLSLEGEGATDLLRSALKTERLFINKGDWRKRNTIPIQVSEGKKEGVSAIWAHHEDGTSVPELKFSKEGLFYIPSDPAMYIDFTDGLIGFLESDLPGSLLKIWEEGPSLDKNLAAPVAEKINSFPSVSGKPIPGPIKLEEEVREVVDPLTKFWIGRIEIDAGRIMVGLPSFSYGDSPELPATDSTYIPDQFSEIRSGKRITWPRKPEAEKELFRLLLDEGFDFAESYFDFQKSDGKYSHALVPSGQVNDDVIFWVNFLESSCAENLRNKGWEIEVDAQAGLDLHDVEEFFPEIEEDSNHGIEWFRFDVSGELEGKKFSMIPHIAHAIKGGILEAMAYSKEREDGQLSDAGSSEGFLPEYMLLPCENPAAGFIRFPSARFQEICQQVAHLFGGNSSGEDGPLRVDRLGAADLADNLSMDSSATIRALAALGKSLKNIDSMPLVEIPDGVKADLREYQWEGFSWLQFLANHGLHGILADDMGLGKTLQTLSHLSAESAKNIGRPSLVIAPTSVVSNWISEAEKFTPGMKVLLLQGSERSEHFDKISTVDLVITSYPLLTRDMKILEKEDWHTIVLDEAQYIKNPKAAVSKNACKLKGAHRICLSGTPMENHLGELWSLMRFLMPGFLGDEKTFNRQFRKPIERERSRDAQRALNRRVSPLILRRTKDQVATELPEKTVIIHHIELTKKQTDLYESVRASMDKRVRDAIETKGLAKSHIIVLDALLKLRQICCHPQLLKLPAAAEIEESAKLDFLTTELLPTLLEEGRRILIFSQFTSMLALIEEHLEKEKIEFLKLTGQTKERGALVKRFQNGEVPIFLISLKAGGTGLNLTAADTVIHYDPWWNPSAENQATDRAHRIGQKKPVFVHKLACRGTIEDRILELQKHKSTLVEALLSAETTKLKIDSTTLSHLLSPLE